jgi:hypothetical protein
MSRFPKQHSSIIERCEPLKFGAYEELAEDLPKEKLIEVLIKEAQNYAKERQHDVSPSPS